MNDLNKLRSSVEEFNKRIYNLLLEDDSDSVSSPQANLRNRLRLLIWLYARDVKHDPIVGNTVIDEMFVRINSSSMRSVFYDDFFKDYFSENPKLSIIDIPNIKQVESYFHAFKTHEFMNRVVREPLAP